MDGGALASQSPDKSDTKPEFRKPVNDASNRKYRRHSPVSRSPSSSSSGSPKDGRKYVAAGDRWKTKDDGKDFNRDLVRNRSSKGDNSYRFERHAHGNSHAERRFDDCGRSLKHIEEERGYHRSSWYGNNSKGGSRHDTDRDGYRSGKSTSIEDKGSRGRENERSSMAREHRRDVDSSRNRQRDMNERDRDRSRERNGKEENKTDHKRSSRDDWNDHSSSREAYREHRRYPDTGLERGDKVSRRKLDDTKEPFDKEDNSEVVSKSAKYKKNEVKIEKNQVKGGSRDEDCGSSRKGLGSSNWDKVDDGLNVMKSQKCAAGEIDEAPSKQQEDPTGKSILGLPPASAAEATQDLNAAKVAAMKAAELVNRNLVGVSFLSTDQKKKLLWGNKKTSTAEESGSKRWDLFPDRERQEKFNKLMSLRLPWPIVGCERRGDNRKGGRRERQCGQPSSCREAEGTRARFRETLHCRLEASRRSNSGPWPLVVILSDPSETVTQSFSMHRFLSF